MTLRGALESDTKVPAKSGIRSEAGLRKLRKNSQEKLNGRGNSRESLRQNITSPKRIIKTIFSGVWESQESINYTYYRIFGVGLIKKEDYQSLKHQTWYIVKNVQFHPTSQLSKQLKRNKDVRIFSFLLYLQDYCVFTCLHFNFPPPREENKTSPFNPCPTLVLSGNEKVLLIHLFMPFMNTFITAAVVLCFAWVYIFFSSREPCRIGKHDYSGTRCKRRRQRRIDRGMRALLMGDIIYVSRSEHLSIYIQSCCGPQPDLMYNSCRTCERGINTVARLVSIAHSQHFCSPRTAS